MATSERYQPGHEPETLRFMARRSASTHAAHFTPLLEPGHTVLDVACGPGTMSVDFAAAVGSKGSVTGVDQVDHQFHIGQALAAERGLTNINFHAADAYALPFDEDTFDRVFCNALLEHVIDPTAILREFSRVLKPGGVAAVATPDWDGFVFAPPDAGLYEATDLYRRIQSANGGNPSVGKHLGELLTAAGFEQIHMEGRYENYDDPKDIGDYLAWRFDRWADEGHAAEVAAPEELRAAATAFRAWGWLPYTMFAQTWIWATAVKP